MRKFLAPAAAFLFLLVASGFLYAGDALPQKEVRHIGRGGVAAADPAPAAASRPVVPARLTVTPTPEPPPPPPPVETPPPAPEPPPAEPAPAEPAQPAFVEAPPGACKDVRYLSWVWQFSRDGPAAEIAAQLAEARMGVLVKTRDGTDWMAVYDTSPDAVTGPERVRALADLFEGQGVPFHAWAVVKGLDPQREAEMAAQVLAAGARSIYLDLEPFAGFWQGTPEAALAFGQELRRLQPDAVVITAVDPRPFLEVKAPIAEFASFSNALAPLVYWDTFDSPENREKFSASGFPVGPEGVTPEFLLDVSATLLGPYGLPLRPVGQGSSSDMAAWASFLDHGAQLGIMDASVWRHGVTKAEVWPLLRERTPSGLAYVVQPGDTLGSLAARWGVSVEAIAGANGITDPNFISVGQVLCVPSA